MKPRSIPGTMYVAQSCQEWFLSREWQVSPEHCQAWLKKQNKGGVGKCNASTASPSSHLSTRPARSNSQAMNPNKVAPKLCQVWCKHKAKGRGQNGLSAITPPSTSYASYARSSKLKLFPQASNPPAPTKRQGKKGTCLSVNKKLLQKLVNRNWSDSTAGG